MKERGWSDERGFEGGREGEGTSRIGLRWRWRACRRVRERGWSDERVLREGEREMGCPE